MQKESKLVVIAAVAVFVGLVALAFHTVDFNSAIIIGVALVGGIALAIEVMRPGTASAVQVVLVQLIILEGFYGTAFGWYVWIENDDMDDTSTRPEERPIVSGPPIYLACSNDEPARGQN